MADPFCGCLRQVFETILETIFETIISTIFETIFETIFGTIFETYLKQFLRQFVKQFLKQCLRHFLGQFLRHAVVWRVIYVCRLTVIWIFPKGSDFGNEWQILFSVAWGQQNAISWTNDVAFNVFHHGITYSRHWSFFILEKEKHVKSMCGKIACL